MTITKWADFLQWVATNIDKLESHCIEVFISSGANRYYINDGSNNILRISRTTKNKIMGEFIPTPFLNTAKYKIDATLLRTITKLN